MGWGWWIDSLNISYEQQIFVVHKQQHLHNNANPHTHTVRKFSTMKWFFILWYYYILKLSSWNAATQYIDTVFTSIQCSRALFLFQQIFSNSAYQPGGYQPPLGHKPSPNQQNHWYISGGLLVASAPPGFIIMSGLGGVLQPRPDQSVKQLVLLCSYTVTFVIILYILLATAFTTEAGIAQTLR